MRSRQRPVGDENALGRLNLADQLRQAFYVIARCHRRDFLAFRRSRQCRSQAKQRTLNVLRPVVGLSIGADAAPPSPRTAATQLVREL
jgi:hypothetical protein